MKRFLPAAFIIIMLSLAGCVSQRVNFQQSSPVRKDFPNAEESPADIQDVSFLALSSVQPQELAAHRTLELDYETAPWYQGHQAALSLTFDDGTLDQYLLAYPELERRSLKATFFLLSDYVDEGVWWDFKRSRMLMNWDHARELAQKGHEIGSHGHTHIELLDGEFIEDELQLSQAVIEREIPNQRCVSLSWPFWRSSQASRGLAETYYIAARAGGADPERYMTRNGDVLSPNPQNLFEIGCIGILPDEAELWSHVSEAVFQSGGWIVLCLHGLDDGSAEKDALGWQAMPLSSFRALLDHIQARDLWIAPFGEVARYIRERQNIEIRVLERTDKRLVLLLSDGLDDGIFDHPLSFRISLPYAWEAVRVLQGSRLIPSALQPDGSLQFDAVPDRGLVTIIKKSSPIPQR